MKYYTAKQLNNLKKFEGKCIDAYPHHYEYWNAKIHQYQTVYEIRGISSTIKENFETPEEIMKYEV